MKAIHSASGPEATDTCARETVKGVCLNILSPTLPVSSRILSIDWQLDVPGAQTVTLTVGLLGYTGNAGSLTVIARTFDAELVPEEGTDELAGAELVPPPPQPAMHKTISKTETILFDFIWTHPRGD
jgi:hypothetical protein